MSADLSLGVDGIVMTTDGQTTRFDADINLHDSGSDSEPEPTPSTPPETVGDNSRSPPNGEMQRRTFRQRSSGNANISRARPGTTSAVRSSPAHPVTTLMHVEFGFNVSLLHIA
jgi:hypothetical protein